MKFSNLYKKACAVGILLTATALSSCEKDGNPNNLPELDPNDYVGTIGGFKTTDEILKDKLVAYFSFDDNYSEKITNTAPTQTAGNSLVDGFKGKALNLDAGYLYFANQFAAFKTDPFRSFTISSWIQITNNGSKRTMLMQWARPGLINGSLDIRLNTNGYPATNTDVLKVGPRFFTESGGSQDNLNATLSPKIGPGNWVHLVLSYNGKTGRFNVLTNGINIGSYSDRGVGGNLFKSYEPGEFIIGGNYNVIPGKAINTSTEYAAMTGKIDEVKIYNAFMPDAVVNAMYKLYLEKK